MIEKAVEDMNRAEYKSYILSQSKVYVVDNVKLYVQSKTSDGIESYRIYLDCPCCNSESIQPHTKIGEHLLKDHEVTHVFCPGTKCAKTKTGEYNYVVKHVNLGYFLTGPNSSHFASMTEVKFEGLPWLQKKKILG